MNDRMSKNMLPLEAFITLGRHVVILVIFLLMLVYVSYYSYTLQIAVLHKPVLSGCQLPSSNYSLL